MQVFYVATYLQVQVFQVKIINIEDKNYYFSTVTNNILLITSTKVGCT